jgi:selenocysteine-specific elongation factor
VKSVVVGTAGHIDHGKSALVLALTGTDPDRLKEEKARGITIDLGFAHQSLADVNFAFVDVPGHERFVKNMLAGVGGIDLVTLVVAADESVMPQTREHFAICRLLRVPAGLVALTKADLVDADTLAIARLEVEELVAGSFLEGAPILPVSSKTGEGLDALRDALVAASRIVSGRPVDAAARLPVDRVFSMKGFGTVVTGTLVSGRIATGDELLLAPGDVKVTVRGVQVHGQKHAEAVAGQRAAINLAGIDVHDVQRGQTLVTPGVFEETRIVEASVELLSDAKPLKHGARVRFHQGTVELMGRVAIVGPVGDARGVPVVGPGARAFVRLRLEAPAVLARGDRYILRAYSPPTTIAGGVVLDPRPQRTALRSVATLERCRALVFDPVTDDPVAPARTAARVMIDGAGAAALPVSALTSRAGIDPRVRAAHVDALVAAGHAARAGDVLVATGILKDLTGAIVAMLTAHHRAEPLSDGVAREALRERVFRRGHSAVFDRALADLVEAGTLVVRDRVALATHRPALSADEDRIRLAIERALREAGLTPPDAATIAASIGGSAAVVDKILKLLTRQRVLVRVDTLVFHDEVLKKLKAEVAGLKLGAGAGARIDVATFKERFGVTRKFAIPLLEYLDRERVTRRVGDARVIL